MEYTEQEELYLQAKSAYYDGDPIMTDDAFDALEQELKDQDSEVTSIVGAEDEKSKVKHLTPMASLAKIQFKQDYQPIDEFDSFRKKILAVDEEAEIEFTPKYDGNACNLLYVEGKFVSATSRGDGIKGQDLTEKVKNIVPKTISLNGNIEVRGELVMSLDIFNEHYSHYKNPRNFVAGLLGRDDLDYTNLDRLTFMAFEMRVVFLRADQQHTYDFPTNSMDTLYDLGFNHRTNEVEFYYAASDVDIVEVFEKMKAYREKSEFLLDGFVCKAPEQIRKAMGETSHHPKWALAVKFPPKSAVSTVIDVEWNLGKTGQLTPVGILEPVELEGTTVQRVTLHNYEWILNKKVCPGAVVEIVKSGDIIPAIVNVIKESDSDLEVPSEYAGLSTKIVEGKHLVVEGFENLAEFGSSKLHRGARALEIDYIGPAMAERLFEANITSVLHLFDPYLMNDEHLSKFSFKSGSREVERLLTEVNRVKEIEFWKAINALQLDRVGKSLSKEAAKFYTKGVEPDWSGYEKAVVAKLTDIDSKESCAILAFCDVLEKANIKIVKPVQKSSAELSGIIEMTGSPKEFGFKTKAEFLKFASDNGFEHGKLNADATYLLTDSHDSSSSKMKKAKKLGVEILTYDEFVNKVS